MISMGIASALLETAQRRADQAIADATLWTLVAILVLALDLLVIVRVTQSHKAFLVKVVWILLVLFLPLLGLILYFFLGREA